MLLRNPSSLYIYYHCLGWKTKGRGLPGGPVGQNHLTMQGTRVWSLVQEDPTCWSPSRVDGRWWGHTGDPWPQGASRLKVPILSLSYARGSLLWEDRPRRHGAALSWIFIQRMKRLDMLGKLRFCTYHMNPQLGQEKASPLQSPLWFHNSCPVQEGSWQVAKASINRELSQSQLSLLSVSSLDLALCLPVEWRLIPSSWWISHLVKVPIRLSAY